MKILIKERFPKDYVSRQAGESLREEILKAIKSKQNLVIDFEDLVIASTSFFDEGIAKLVSETTPEEFKEYVTLENLNRNDEKVLNQVSNYRNFKISMDKHPWRLCPIGEHWVKEHPRKTDLGSTSVEGHCRKNPKNKDIIKSEELLNIANKNFYHLTEMPTPKSLGFAKGNEFDQSIAGWCQYWNEVLNSKIKLSPNIVKVLIATESGFEPEPKVPKGHKAIGIMQLMPETLQLLSHRKKELKDHFIEVSPEEARDPNINISAGIRWLFRKFELTEHKLKRTPTWEEVLLDYKGILTDHSKEAQRIKSNIEKYLKELK